MQIVAANEINKSRADLYRKMYPQTEMVCGNINNENIFKTILDVSGKKVDFLLASPPCQGVSVAGKNRKNEDMIQDERNYLIYRVIDFIKIKTPSYILIENVPSFLKLRLPHEGKHMDVVSLLELYFKNVYNIDAKVVDAADYGVPQVRKRAIIKIFKKNLKWPWPTKSKKVTVREAIGHLPSLEAGEKSSIPLHYARKHSESHILWMSKTPTGKSAFENLKYYPKKSNGEKVKGYLSSYRRIRWDQPAPTITIRNDAISSQRNVHPGNRKKNGDYSDARVLTPLELIILNSLPIDGAIPELFFNFVSKLRRSCVELPALRLTLS